MKDEVGLSCLRRLSLYSHRLDSRKRHSTPTHFLEEVKPALRDLVQPVEVGTMFFSKRMGNPNNCDRFEASSVCEELPQVRMVRLRKLVLDKDPVTRDGVLAENVCTKWPDTLLLRFQFQISTNGVPKEPKIVGLGEPRRKVACLC